MDLQGPGRRGFLGPGTVADVAVNGVNLPVIVDLDGTERHAVRVTITAEAVRLLQTSQPNLRGPR